MNGFATTFLCIRNVSYICFFGNLAFSSLWFGAKWLDGSIVMLFFEVILLDMKFSEFSVQFSIVCPLLVSL